MSGKEVLFLELAPVTDPAFVPGRLAAVLGVALDPNDPLSRLVAALGDKRLLLVLDGCEHLIEPVAELVGNLLRHAPDLCVLATSREPLRVQGEWVTRVPPLTSPARSAQPTAEEALEFPAVQLFVERAADALGGYALSDADAPRVAELCARLDGIALAIELAAGRMDTLSVSELAAQLDDRLRILTRGRRSALPRHQTLRAALDWSYELLEPLEKTLFRRLSIFRGSFTFAALEEVCADSALPAEDISDLLIDLVTKSLVAADPGVGERSYRLLDTMRAYALEKHIAAGDRELGPRHARYVCRVFSAGAEEWRTQPSTGWLARHLRHLDDLRAALQWVFGQDGDPSLGVDLAIAAVPLWAQLSLADEFLFWVERALAASQALEATDRRREMQLYAALGGLQMYGKSRVREANEAWAAALAIAEELGDLDFQLRAFRALWAERINQGQFRLALGHAETFQSLAASASETDDRLIADRMLGTALHFLGEHDAADEAIERMLSRYVRPPGRRDIVRYQFDQRVAARIVRARVLWVRGRPDSALREIEDNVAEALALDHSMSLCNLLTQAACPIGLLIRDDEATGRHIRLLREHTEARALDIWNTYAVCFEAEAAIRGGQAQAGVPQLSAAIEGLRKAGFAHYLTWFLGSCAEGLCGLGQHKDALAALAEALAICEGTGERWCLPELHRLRGEVLRRAEPDGAGAEIENAFRLALKLAREQGAVAWELRAAGSLGSLLAERGRPADALALLEPVYLSLTEGRERADALHAGSLLSAWRAATG